MCWSQRSALQYENDILESTVASLSQFRIQEPLMNTNLLKKLHDFLEFSDAPSAPLSPQPTLCLIQVRRLLLDDILVNTREQQSTIEKILQDIFPVIF